ncbi:hypothetical protein HBB16_06170 [Pseudonocardia sp. MCCB 268]|nr:hypothetical protein [Pseudonocardia cytotoxica]
MRRIRGPGCVPSVSPRPVALRRRRGAGGGGRQARLLATGAHREQDQHVVVDGGAARFDRAAAFRGTPAGENSNTGRCRARWTSSRPGCSPLAPRTSTPRPARSGSTPGRRHATRIERDRRRPRAEGRRRLDRMDPGRRRPGQAVHQVQGRLVLTSTGNATPVVRAVTLSAAPTVRQAEDSGR